MALFSHSESAYITTFLSTVDLDSSITPDGSIDPGVADCVPQLQGREALAKATKDLMSLDIPAGSTHHQLQTNPSRPTRLSNSGPAYWPSLPAAESASSASAHRLGTSSVRSSSSSHHLSPGAGGSASPTDPSRSSQQLDRISPSNGTLYYDAHVQIAPLRGFDPSPSTSSGFTLPPITTSGFPNGVSAQDSSAARPSAAQSPASPPSVLSSSSTLASNKRPLPSSSQPATDPSSSKRLRSSPPHSSVAPGSAEAPSDILSSSGAAARPRRNASSGQSKNTPALPQPSSRPSGGSGPNLSSGNSTAGAATTTATAIVTAAPAAGGNGNKGNTLLSPSQKRANHIQSEQKRRANIRRGYEALCEAVPALREAIRAEEDRERVREREKELEGFDAPGGGGKAKTRGSAEKGRKKKGGRADGDKADGRAGPRSENVVLQKTIDYITGLIAERRALQERLELARGMLPLGHPALPVDPHHVDPNGVPLWQREWNGGMDLDVTGGAGEEEGSDDDS